MTVDERDDYQADIQFGEWLRSQRMRSGLSLEAAAQSAGLAAERLKGLEMGLSQRGITRPEAVRLCTAYKIALEELLSLAARG